MSQQIQISGGAKVRDLQDVIIGTSGVLSSLAFNVSNGVPKLDVNGKILVSQLPNSIMEYKGVWNAATNSPTLTNGGAFNQGDVYLCDTAGTVNFGSGSPISFIVGDQAIYSGSVWQKAGGATGTVTSVAVTETGDSLNITGSPITTSGTINIGFNGTNLQYVNGAGNLTTFPILTGYVTAVNGTAPVVSSGGTTPAISMAAATGSVDGYLLATDFAIFSAKQSALTFSSPLVNTSGTISIPAATTSVNGYLASADFTTFNNKQNAITLTTTGSSGVSTLVGATLNIPDYGSALTGYVTLATTQTITGAKTFSGYTTFTSTVDITSGLTFSNSGFTLLLQPPTLSVNRTVTLPNATGTIALTSDIPSITGLVPYTGATGDVNLGLYSLTSNAIKVIGDNSTYGGTLSIKQSNVTNLIGVGYTELFGKTNRLGISFGAGSIAYLSNSTLTAERTYTLPDATGTIALVGGSGVGTVTSVAALTIGTSGTDLSSSVANSTTTPVITLNVPTASATNRGALSSADWTTFNNKQSALTNPVTGTGTTNYLPKFTGASTIGNSNIQDSGSLISVAVAATFSGVINANSSGQLKLESNNETTNIAYANFINTSGFLRWGVESSAGGGLFSGSSAYSSVIGTVTNTNFHIATNTSVKLTLDTSGNLGLGVTPSAWGGVKALQIGDYSAVFDNSTYTILSNNVYYNSGNKYINAAKASQIYLNGGNIVFEVNNITGTAGNAITFTQAMTLTASGNLLIGTTTDYTSKLVIIPSSNPTSSTGANNQISIGETSNNTGYCLKLGYINTGGGYQGSIQSIAGGSGSTLFLNASGGNVLIGTTTDAGYKLDVNGTTRFSGTSIVTSAGGYGQGLVIQNTTATANNFSVLTLQANTDGYPIIEFKEGSDQKWQIYNNYVNDSLNFYKMGVGAGDVLTLASTGAATFSNSFTTSDTSALFLSPSLGTNQTVFLQLGKNIADTYNSGEMSFKFVASGSSSNMVSLGFYGAGQKLNVLGNGNVGIGTSSPNLIASGNVHLDIRSTTYSFLEIGTTSTITNNDVGYLEFMNGNNTRLATIVGGADGTALAGYMRFSTSNSSGSFTERMRITSGGNVLITDSSGNLPTGYGTNRLVVNGGIYATSSIAAVVAADIDMLAFVNTGATYSKACVVASMTATGGTGSYFFYGQQSTSTAAIKIFSNGNIQNTNNSYGAISDARLKENIKDATPKLDDLMKVKVRNYNLKGESNKQLGVISQELEAIFPNMIEESTNMGENMKIKGVKYSVFVPMLIKAVQEQQQQINELKQLINK